MSYNFIVKFTSVLRQKVDTWEDVEAKFRGAPAHCYFSCLVCKDSRLLE